MGNLIMDFEAGKVVVDMIGVKYTESACIQKSGDGIEPKNSNAGRGLYRSCRITPPSPFILDRGFFYFQCNCNRVQGEPPTRAMRRRGWDSKAIVRWSGGTGREGEACGQ